MIAYGSDVLSTCHVFNILNLALLSHAMALVYGNFNQLENSLYHSQQFNTPLVKMILHYTIIIIDVKETIESFCFLCPVIF